MIEKRKLSHTVIKNTFYNFIGRFWGIFVGIFIIPYIIGRIGIERFGIWAIVGVITGYFGLLDFGIGISFVKYISEFITKRQEDKISSIVSTGFTLYFFVTALILSLVFIFIRPILSMLNIPPKLYYEAALVLFLGVGLFGASNMMSAFASIQSGMQRMDISNKVNILSSIIGVIGTIFFLEKGYGLVGLMLNNVLVFLVTSAINIIIAFRLVPGLKFRPFTVDYPIVRTLFKFGYNVQTAKISGMVVNQVDKLLIAGILSIALVSYYQLGNSIVYYASSFAAILTYALMPAFSEIEARGERGRLSEAYLRSIKYIGFIVIPCFILLAISARMLMFIWMGEGYEKSVIIIQVLSAAFLINTIAQVSASASFAIDKPELTARGSVITIVVNIFLSAFLIKRFGFSGSAWGVLIAVNLGTIYFLRQLHLVLNIKNKKFIAILLPYLISSVLACVIIFMINFIVNKFQPVHGMGRSETLGLLVINCFIFLIMYMVSLAVIKPFNGDDINILKDKAPLLGRMVKKVFVKA